MKNKVIYSLGTIGLLLILFTTFNKMDYEKVKETKSNIDEIRLEKKRLFDIADSTMKDIEIRKKERQMEIYRLDSVLNINKVELQKSFLLLEKNKKQSDSLKKLVKEYEQVKLHLDKQITEKNEHIEYVTKERDDYKSRYDYVCDNNEPIIIRDTIFIYDTTSRVVTTKKKTRGKN